MQAKGIILTMKTQQRTNTTNDKQTQRLAFPTYDEEDILNRTYAFPPLIRGVRGLKAIISMIFQ